MSVAQRITNQIFDARVPVIVKRCVKHSTIKINVSSAEEIRVFLPILELKIRQSFAH